MTSWRSYAMQHYLSDHLPCLLIRSLYSWECLSDFPSLCLKVHKHFRKHCEPFSHTPCRCGSCISTWQKATIRCVVGTTDLQSYMCLWNASFYFPHSFHTGSSKKVGTTSTPTLTVAGDILKEISLGVVDHGGVDGRAIQSAHFQMG